MSDKSAQERSEVQGMLAGGVIGGVTLVPVVALADDATSQVSTAVTALGGITAAATTVILAGIGVRLAIKMVNRLTVKG